jgi:hypothetical protein
MKNITWMVAAAITTLTVGALSAITASPAQAVGTAMTLTLTGGALEISAPATADLGSVAAMAAGRVYAAQLGEVVVTDNRAAAAGSGWIASAISTALTPTSGPAIAATYIAYAAGTVATTGTVTTTNNDPSTIIGVSPVVTATAITGSNTATWNPTLSITIGGTFVAGVYTGTITHSVL